jgi:hypothetical protein
MTSSRKMEETEMELAWNWLTCGEVVNIHKDRIWNGAN